MFLHIISFFFSGIARYTDCKMFIRFAISDDGMKLVVNGKLEGHNHEEVCNLIVFLFFSLSFLV